MAEIKDKVYSYHNFIFPFIWENHETKANEKESIERFFENNKYWKSTNLDNSKLSKEEWIDLYSRNEYFHPSFREAILGYNAAFERDKSIVSHYKFDQEMLRRGAEYIIVKSYSETSGSKKDKVEIKKKEYHLDISGISIKIFNTGIAILILECLNHQYQKIQDIKWINDYGRRISLPFVPLGADEISCTYSICADSLTVRIPGAPGNVDLMNVTESFLEQIREIHQQKNFSMKDIQERSNHVCEWICELFRIGNGNRSPFSNGTDKNNEIQIHPALDERMYVMCLINSEKAGEKGDLIEQIFSDTEEAKKVRELKSDWMKWMNKSQQEVLYKLAFVDAKDCTCQSDMMREELLRKSIYDRWIKYGTIYTVTPQAFMCISNDGITIKSFRNMYLDMCVLVLVQRASLINFQNIALRLSKGLERIGEVIDTKKIIKLMDLQERFIAFQNQINLQEISSQEQAVELYEKLKKASYVEELTGAMKEQLDALYDATNTNQDFSFNKWALLFAIVSLGIDAPGYLMNADGKFSLIPIKNGVFQLMQAIPYEIILIITVVIFINVFCRFKRKKKK